MSFLVNPYWYASAGCTDSDALAFLTAAGITDATITSAICTLVTSMKANGTWAKCIAIYPFCGSTASQQKWNLKDPRDLNDAYRLSFEGGWTHSANGALGNGVNTYANTFIVPSAGALTLNNTHISFYSRTDTSVVSIDMGSYNTATGGNNLFCLFITKLLAGNSFQYDQGTTSNIARAATITDTRGLFMGSRTSNVANTHKLWRNGSVIGTASTTGGAFRADVITIGAVLTNYFSVKQFAFASIGAGFTDTEAAAFYSSIQTFQTTLSRQV